MKESERTNKSDALLKQPRQGQEVFFAKKETNEKTGKKRGSLKEFKNFKYVKILNL